MRHGSGAPQHALAAPRTTAAFPILPPGLLPKCGACGPGRSSRGLLRFQVEDLFLTFAKKASAFNSWFENAEEDLTDPVRCNSLEEIRALREAHDAFRSSLSSAQADFSQLAELDRQIKSFRVASNPYTWFTMEALEETWRNLQKIIKVPPAPAQGHQPAAPAPPHRLSVSHFPLPLARVLRGPVVSGGEWRTLSSPRVSQAPPSG